MAVQKILYAVDNNPRVVEEAQALVSPNVDGDGGNTHVHDALAAEESSFTSEGTADAVLASHLPPQRGVFGSATINGDMLQAKSSMSVLAA